VNDYAVGRPAGEVRPGAESLAMLTALRQIGAQYKLPAARRAAWRNCCRRPGGRGRGSGSSCAAAELLQQHLGGAFDYRPLEARRYARERLNRFQARNLTDASPPSAAAGIGFNLQPRQPT